MRQMSLQLLARKKNYNNDLTTNVATNNNSLNAETDSGPTQIIGTTGDDFFASTR